MSVLDCLLSFIRLITDLHTRLDDVCEQAADMHEPIYRAHQKRGAGLGFFAEGCCGSVAA